MTDEEALAHLRFLVFQGWGETQDPTRQAVERGIKALEEKIRRSGKEKL